MKAYTPHLCEPDMQSAYFLYTDSYALYKSLSAPYCLLRGLVSLLTLSLGSGLIFTRL